MRAEVPKKKERDESYKTPMFSESFLCDGGGGDDGIGRERVW